MTCRLLGRQFIFGDERIKTIMTHALMWFRQDLRCADNSALFAACREHTAAVTALYCITPEQWIEHDVAGVRIDFERRHLAELKRDLNAIGMKTCVPFHPAAYLRRMAATTPFLRHLSATG